MLVACGFEFRRFQSRSIRRRTVLNAHELNIPKWRTWYKTDTGTSTSGKYSISSAPLKRLLFLTASNLSLVISNLQFQWHRYSNTVYSWTC